MTKSRLEDAVALLDLPSWEHVGAELLSHGITDGEQENCERCPIAQYLRGISGRCRISVGATAAWPRRFGTRNEVPLPTAAQAFIRWFDDLRWA